MFEHSLTLHSSISDFSEFCEEAAGHCLSNICYSCVKPRQCTQNFVKHKLRCTDEEDLNISVIVLIKKKKAKTERSVILIYRKTLIAIDSWNMLQNLSPPHHSSTGSPC